MTPARYMRGFRRTCPTAGRLPLRPCGKDAAVSGPPRPPDCLSLEEHRDHAHPVERWVRWALVATLGALALAALAGAFGQRSSETSAAGEGAILRLTAPGALRSGLFFQGRFEVEAARAIRRPTLVLRPGWLDAITLNTVEPEPERTASEDGAVSLEFPPLAAGRALTVYLELHVNPTTFGRRDQGAVLRGGDRTLVAVDRTVTIFP